MKPFHGIIVPLLTPIDAEGKFDAGGMQRLLEHLLAHPVGGVLVGGTTGEVLALNTRDRRHSLQAACKAAAGRTTVMAGIGSPCMEQTLHLAQIAHDAGADALVLTPPPYFPMTQDQLRGYFLDVMDHVTLPTILYNIPGFTKNSLEVPLVAELKNHPRAIGIKDSTGDRDYFAALMRECHDENFFVQIGDESRITECVTAGAAGCTASLANVFPDLCIECHRLAAAGERELSQVVQDEIWHKIVRFRESGDWAGMIRWLKQELHTRGVCEPYLTQLFERAHKS